MNDVIEGAELSVDCECGAVVKATVGQLRRSPTLTCPNGHEINVDGSQLDSDLRRADRALDKLDRTIKNFGK
jgi:hypothetical protein